MGKIVRILVVLAVLIGLLFLGKNTIIKAAVERGVEKATGLPMKIGKFDLGLTNSQVGIWDIELLNPAGFPDKVMFHSPEIFVDYHLGDALKGTVHLENMRLNFDQFTVVKNAQGKLNIDAFKKMSAGKKAEGESKPSEDQGKAKEIPDIRIDHLSLKVGKVVYKDYSQGGEPVVKEFNVNISEEFKDITDVQSLVMMIVSRAMSKAALTSLVDFNIEGIEGFTTIPQGALEGLKDAAGSITDKIKLPFGN